MADAVISVEQLSKQYRLGVTNYGHLRKDLQSWWARTRGKEDPNSKIGESRINGASGTGDRFWALKDICFQVTGGERLGIIGRNGAGKSTLLKILSRVTSPTEGRVRIKGGIASLLEVGTGFNPELTGRENIFLNGAILGMSKAEVRKKFDEIVDFAEVSAFIDTPIKRYSSGMYVRLAFAVAAHLEPDILVIDEVLAVGDVAFQKKCLGKMEDVSKKEGRTVLFVSHNMGAISSLCDRCILLSNGKMEADGRTSEVVLKYYSANGRFSGANVDFTMGGNFVGDRYARLDSAKIEDEAGRNAHEFTIHDTIRISMAYTILEESGSKMVPNIHLFTSDGGYAFVTNAPGMSTLAPGRYAASCEIPPDLLNEGTYTVGLALTAYSQTSFSPCFFERDALSFHVKDPLDEFSNRYGYAGEMPGSVRPLLKWKVEETRK